MSYGEQQRAAGKLRKSVDGAHCHACDKLAVHRWGYEDMCLFHSPFDDWEEEDMCHCGGIIVPSTDDNPDLSPQESLCSACGLVYASFEYDDCEL